MILSGEVYDEILDKLGIERLKENECILINKAFETKYENKENLTNYEVGDTLVLKELDRRIIQENIVLTEEKREKEQQINAIFNEMLGDLATNTQSNENNSELINNRYELQIVAVANEKLPFFDSEHDCMTLIISPETYQKMADAENTDIVNNKDYITTFYISTEYPDKIEEAIEGIEGVSGMNVKEENEKMHNNDLIQKVIIYAFIILIALFSILNIYNTIFSSIILRKKEFAMLKSIGMSNRQINKMLFLETIFYGLDAIIYGVLISLIILYIIYIALVETNVYAFYIPVTNILLCIAISYIVIFLSIFSAKKVINKYNIIDQMRKEII